LRVEKSDFLRSAEKLSEELEGNEQVKKRALARAPFLKPDRQVCFALFIAQTGDDCKGAAPGSSSGQNWRIRHER